MIAPERRTEHAQRPAEVVHPAEGALPRDADYRAPVENRLTAREGRYYLDGRPAILRAAELQYFRVPAEQWAESIDKLRAAGTEDGGE